MLNQKYLTLRLLLRSLMGPFVYLMVASSCNDSGFSGDNGKKVKQALPARPILEPDTQLSIPCVDGKGQLVKKLSGVNDPVVALEGEFCGSAQLSSGAPLTVLFIIDGSGSMRTSDPTSGGSCGRLKATEQILKTLKSSSGSQIQVALHNFGDLSQSVLEPSPLDRANSLLNPGTLCGFGFGGTNYQSALTKAKETLQSIQGKKVVYFITDGAPSMSGTSASNLNIPQANIRTQADAQRILGPIYNAGLTAADQLRALDQLSLYTLFLQEPASGSQNSLNIYAEDPETYLKKIAGDPQRFRLATSAEELAEKIAEFDAPTDLTLEPSTLVATLESTGFASKTIKIKSLVPTDKPGIWRFVSEPFVLNTRPGQSLLNSITLTVKSSDGQTLETVAKIDYLKEN